MTAQGDTLGSDIDTILSATWNARDGQVVPETKDVALSNGAVRQEATILYADLAGSTKLARTFPDTTAAKIVKAYLSTMSKLVTQHGGEVRSFDGDRVMGVFVEGWKNTNAAKCALRMNYMVEKVLRPKAEAKFPALQENGFVIRHCAGIAKSDVFVVRGGVRGNNDLVFIGTAANIAAKLSEIRNTPYHSYMTWHVHKYVQDPGRLSAEGEPMWEQVQLQIGDESWTCYRSNWHWAP